MPSLNILPTIEDANGCHSDQMQRLLNRVNDIEETLKQEMRDRQHEHLLHEARVSKLESYLSGQRITSKEVGAETGAPATFTDIALNGLEENVPSRFQVLPHESGVDAFGTTTQQAQGMGVQSQELGAAYATVLTQSLHKELEETRRWREFMEAHMSTPSGKTRFSRFEEVYESKKLEYVLASSMYDSFLLVNLRGIQFRTSVVVGLGFLCLIFMLITTVWVISGEEFLEQPLERREQARRWRSSDAHSSGMVDPLTHRSLVSRVCNDDLGLSVGNQQRELVEDASRYEHRGIYLCNVAVILWACCCALELRTSINFLLAVCSIPRSRMTKMGTDEDGFFFREVSPHRLALGIFIAVVRMTMATLLLFYGSLWLASTSNLETLLLNASALGFVLDIDDIIFALVQPFSIETLLTTMKPMHMNISVLSKKIQNNLLLVAVLIFIIYMNFGPIRSTQTQMQDAIRILCEPENSHHLVQSVNSMGWVLFTRDAISWSDDDEDDADDVHRWRKLHKDLEQDIVSRLVHNPSEGEQYAYEVKDFNQVRVGASSSISDWVNTFGCNDNNSVNLSITTLAKRLWAATGNSTLSTIRSCHQAKPYCGDPGKVGINVRFMCADTCGCADLHSGLWDLSRSQYGCPHRGCFKKLLRKLESNDIECKDLSMAELKNTGWQKMLDRMRFKKDITESHYLNMTELGCKAVVGSNAVGGLNIRDVCTLTESHHNYGAAPFCPVSCQCSSSMLYGVDENCSGLCPKSCCRR